MAFARIEAGIVAELFTPPAGAAIGDCFHPGMTWVDAGGAVPPPHQGWTAAQVSGAWVFAPPPPPPAPTLPELAAAAVNAGLAVTSAGTPALNGTYACDANTQNHLAAEMIALLNSQGAKFADGTASVAWPDIGGASHDFTPLTFSPFALAVGAYVANLFKVINGTATALPPATATIP